MSIRVDIFIIYGPCEFRLPLPLAKRLSRLEGRAGLKPSKSKCEQTYMYAMEWLCVTHLIIETERSIPTTGLDYDEAVVNSEPKTVLMRNGCETLDDSISSLTCTSVSEGTGGSGWRGTHMGTLQWWSKRSPELIHVGRTIICFKTGLIRVAVSRRPLWLNWTLFSHEWMIKMPGPLGCQLY